MKEVEMENLSVKQLRQRLFVKQSSVLYNKSKYTFLDNVPKQIEKIPEFKTWESFSYTWDILWVGLDPRTLEWVPGRHNSPIREIVRPIRIVQLDERTKRMMLVSKDRQDIKKIPCPVKGPLFETEEDRAISESLSGKVVIDEPDEDKAVRMIEETMKDLENRLALIKGMNKK